MNHRDIIRSRVAQAFNKIPSLLKDVIIRRVEYAETFDTEMGVRDKQEVDYPLTGTLKGLPSKYRANELNDKVLVTDVKLLLLQDHLSIIPVSTDKVVIGTDIYNIVSIGKDSIDVTWSLQLRKQ